MLLNWKQMPDGQEKYNAYLASPEWAVLKNAVKARSGGICEHCRLTTGTQTHHQTYIRKYAERLSDLLHVCGQCHLFLSGKGEDPRPRRKLYLAGKISNNDWRKEFFPIECFTWREKAVVSVADEQFDYVGPFFSDACRHCSPHGPGRHGNHPSDGGCNCTGDGDSQDEVKELCLHAIRQSDVVFAWIHRKDVFGTIAELGYAVAMEREVWIGAPNERVLRHMWFVSKMANCVHLAANPVECFKGCKAVMDAYPWRAHK